LDKGRAAPFAVGVVGHQTQFKELVKAGWGLCGLCVDTHPVRLHAAILVTVQTLCPPNKAVSAIVGGFGVKGIAIGDAAAGSLSLICKQG
jgi:hypothetical protein